MTVDSTTIKDIPNEKTTPSALEEELRVGSSGITTPVSPRSFPLFWSSTREGSWSLELSETSVKATEIGKAPLATHFSGLAR
ncbi:hypothetical protein THAOC_32767, partial [Thalassiosira oceanica]